MANRLTEEQIKKFRKRAAKYVTGKGRIDPKWLSLPILDRTFLDINRLPLSEVKKRELYPFLPGTSDEIKFRVLAVHRLCCSLVEDAPEYIDLFETWISGILRRNESLRKKLKIEWEDPLIGVPLSSK